MDFYEGYTDFIDSPIIIAMFVSLSKPRISVNIMRPFCSLYIPIVTRRINLQRWQLSVKTRGEYVGDIRRNLFSLIRQYDISKIMYQINFKNKINQCKAILKAGVCTWLSYHNILNFLNNYWSLKKFGFIYFGPSVIFFY